VWGGVGGGLFLGDRFPHGGGPPLRFVPVIVIGSGEVRQEPGGLRRVTGGQRSE